MERWQSAAAPSWSWKEFRVLTGTEGAHSAFFFFFFFVRLSIIIFCAIAEFAPNVTDTSHAPSPLEPPPRRRSRRFNRWFLLVCLFFQFFFAADPFSHRACVNSSSALSESGTPLMCHTQLHQAAKTSATEWEDQQIIPLLDSSLSGIVPATFPHYFFYFLFWNHRYLSENGQSLQIIFHTTNKVRARRCYAQYVVIVTSAV